ncbi:CLUMA_CG005952, isoform A [Clunio marinus]|uniref:CLUMA_CG005952, isoform A n=1 Tax=Clunio marinus TaxID=568069 RepID=A0A1J1HXV3_9DIPT|nr:CLUMA_CG005952, isoform A [Clunio marinus]
MAQKFIMRHNTQSQNSLGVGINFVLIPKQLIKPSTPTAPNALKITTLLSSLTICQTSKWTFDNQ